MQGFPLRGLYPHGAQLRGADLQEKAGCVDRGGGGVSMEWFGTLCAVIGAGAISHLFMALVDKLDRPGK